MNHDAPVCHHPPVTGSRADKQRDVLMGALKVFARDGFSRASIASIAAEAGVSTRTIYNHYADKAELFHTVIVASADRTARHQIDIVRRRLGTVTDIDAALVGFGTVWARPDPDTALHFALVRQVRADIDHIPIETIEAWQRTGPRQVKAEIAQNLRRWSDLGLIAIPTGRQAAELAAAQLIALTAGVADRPGEPLGDAALLRVVKSGVRVFLAAHPPPR